MSEREFLEHGGVLWRKTGDTNQVEMAPYCPKCRVLMTVPLSYQHFVCPRCRLSSSFRRSELSEVFEKIPKH